MSSKRDSGQPASFVIEVQMDGEQGWLCETKCELFFVATISQATKYKSQRDAEIARCHIASDHNPRIVEIKQ